MDKIKVLLLYKKFPLAMGTYFQRALERRDDVDLKVVGHYTGSSIPWKGGMNVPEKYAIPPDIPLPYPIEKNDVDYDYVKIMLGDWKPDLIINASSNCYWREKPDAYSVAIAVDPHVLDYDHVRKVSDKFYNMQQVYSKPGDDYLPYAYDPTVHFYEEEEKIYDVAMVGLEYGHRLELASKLRDKGLRVYIDTGAIFDEYRKIHNQSHICLNWSTLDDLNARAFEAPMMAIPVMNRVTDMGLPQHSYFDFAYLFGSDNISYDKSRFVPHAVERIEHVMSNLYVAQEQTKEIRKYIVGETYDARISQILKECNF